jgi:hypothetical protein
MILKHCNGCGKDKPLSDFTFHKTGKEVGKPVSRCKECCNKTTARWTKNHPDNKRINARNSSYKKGIRPASENKSCSLYLGCIVAETVLSHEFPGFKRMPPKNSGYDYECPKGFKIDIKSACRRHPKDACDKWVFYIGKNKIADYFLLLAFDSREKLNPEYVWLVPGNVVNDKGNVTISITNLYKWMQYERPLDNVVKCCNRLKDEQ